MGSHQRRASACSWQWWGRFSSRWCCFLPGTTNHTAGPYLWTLKRCPSICFSNHLAPRCYPRAMQVFCTSYIRSLSAVPQPYLGDLWSFIPDMRYNSQTSNPGNIKDGLLPLPRGKATFCYPCQIATDSLVCNPTATQPHIYFPLPCSLHTQIFCACVKLHRSRVCTFKSIPSLG